MTTEEASTYDKMPIKEFRKLPARVQRAYMRVPLPEHRVHEIMAAVRLPTNSEISR